MCPRPLFSFDSFPVVQVDKTAWTDNFGVSLKRNPSSVSPTKHFSLTYHTIITPYRTTKVPLKFG